jgi:hypothetical protein
MDVAAVIDAVARNKGGDYGPGYVDGFDGVMEGDITTPQELYQRTRKAS